jgi:hypothetical protein
MALMRRAIPVLLMVMVALSACDRGGGDAPTPSPAASPTVTPEKASETLGALCDLEAMTDPHDANAAFYDRAHVTLHAIAGASGDVDRGVEAEVLTTMQRVEADLEQPALPDGFPADVVALRTATSDALRLIGLPGSGC